jgi:DNA recombination protein RmuC
MSSGSNKENQIYTDLTNCIISLEKTIKDEFLRNREEITISSKHLREEFCSLFNSFSNSFLNRLNELNLSQKNDINSFSENIKNSSLINEQKIEKLKEKVEEKLNLLYESNLKKLDEMRIVVDEKLNASLEKRLGDSFRLVSERLELVHKGLGEMQSLANGVGDLKRVLTNVKTRGTWGEIQLGSLIEQILTKDQYAQNVVTKKNSSFFVEYAVKMPGKNNEPLWLPIDAKFPLEDYQRLCDAQDCSDLLLIDEAGKALENRIKSEAKDIYEKYIDPPNTTDFGILFLPVEGLYAEALRHPGLCDFIQRQFRVVLAGPTTLTAILNSLQMGFRTLTIEKRSGEVWNLLGTVKTEFKEFGNILDKTKKKLQEASNTIESASTASRRIERKLKDVQELPAEAEE